MSHLDGTDQAVSHFSRAAQLGLPMGLIRQRSGVPPAATAPIHSAAAQVLETAMRRFESTRDVSAPHLALRVGLYAHAAEPVYFKHRMPVFAVIVRSLATSLAPLPPLPFLALLGQRRASERRTASQQHMHPSLPVVLPRCAHSTTPATADSTPAAATSACAVLFGTEWSVLSTCEHLRQVIGKPEEDQAPPPASSKSTLSTGCRCAADHSALD